LALGEGKEKVRVNDVQDRDDIAISIRRALDEQTDQVFALTERIAYLEHAEHEARNRVIEAHEALLARDAELRHLRQAVQQEQQVQQEQVQQQQHLLHLVQQQNEQLTALNHEREALLRSQAISRKILRDVRESRAYRVLLRSGRWGSVERDMRRFFGK
jgi:hypothetical protein